MTHIPHNADVYSVNRTRGRFFLIPRAAFEAARFISKSQKRSAFSCPALDLSSTLSFDNRIEMRFKNLRFVGLATAVALAYLLAARLGLSLASVHTNVSPVWPPTGVAIASLLLFGRSLWPAILFGAFAANLWTGVSIPTAGGIALGNTLEAVLAVSLLTRGKASTRLDSVPHVLRFLLFAVILSPMVGATVGNLSLCLGGAAAWNQFGQLWLTWWSGDGFGALVVAPFVLAWSSTSTDLPSSRSLAESALLLISLYVTAMIIFGGWFPGNVKDYPLEHLCLPFLVWAALRFDQRVLTAAVIVLAGVALWGTSHGYGPFVHGGPNESLLLLQAFVGASSLMALTLFAVISERKKAEAEKLKLAAELRRHRQRVEDIVAHVPGVVWEAWGKPDEATQQIDFVSGYVEKMLGYSEQDWLSTPNFWLAIVSEEDRARAGKEAAEIFASRKGGVSRFRWITKDGREIWVESRSVVVCDEEGEPLGMRGVTMDITSAVRSEQERTELLHRERDARAGAEEANRLRDEFLATVSHELRTPLNAIVGWARLLSSNQLDQQGLKHAVEVIERNAWAQKQIIEDMLDVSRIITGKLRIGLAPIELETILQAAVDVIQPAADAKQITIRTLVDSPGLRVNGDAERLQQVAWNLLSNAVKFTKPGGAVEVILRERGGQVEIRVADDGPGIAPEFLPHVFERFSQADSSSTRRHGGLGLGLAIARHLVELHGGTVKAENRENRAGAILTVTLPALAGPPSIARLS
jgi:PAS domain S-box-containing protein